MKKFKLYINNRKVDKFESLKDVEGWFKNEGITKLELGDEEFELEEGVIEIYFTWQDGVVCWNEQLCERGDDYCEIRIEED